MIPPFREERKRSVVSAGICTDTYECALSGNTCFGGNENFMSSRQTEDHMHAQACTSDEETQRITIGKCGVDGPCASVRELCDDPSSFIENSPSCNVKDAYYGSCSGGNNDSYFDQSTPLSMCYWSSDDCDHSDEFEHDEDCTCDKVRVGACTRWNEEDDAYEIYCAINADACDEDQTFVPADQRFAVSPKKERTSSRETDCYLCSRSINEQQTLSSFITESPTTKISSLSSSFAPITSNAPFSAPIESTLSPISSNNNNGDTLENKGNNISVNDNNNGISITKSNIITTGNEVHSNSTIGIATIITAVILASMVAFIVLITIVRRRYRNKKLEDEKDDITEEVPNGEYI